MMVVGGWGAVSVGQAGVHTYPVQGHTQNIKLARVLLASRSQVMQCYKGTPGS